MKTSAELAHEIDHTLTATPTLWWLGGAGFIVRFANITFYVDALLSRKYAPLHSSDVKNADMLLATRADEAHLDPASAKAVLEACPLAKLVLPKSAGERAHAAGIDYSRLTTTDSDLRVEFWKDDLYGRIYAVPSARRQPDGTAALEWTPLGGFPSLGYLIRFGRWTIYHSGHCAMYEGLAQRLKPYNVSVALMAIGENGFSAAEAAQLAGDIGAKWIVPMGDAMGAPMGHAMTGHATQETGFVAHMLGQRPEQQFNLMEIGERWTVPEE